MNGSREPNRRVGLTLSRLGFQMVSEFAMRRRRDDFVHHHPYLCWSAQARWGGIGLSNHCALHPPDWNTLIGMFRRSRSAHWGWRQKSEGSSRHTRGWGGLGLSAAQVGSSTRNANDYRGAKRQAGSLGVFCSFTQPTSARHWPFINHPTVQSRKLKQPSGAVYGWDDYAPYSRARVRDLGC